MPKTTKTEPQDAGRGANGRFTKGNKYGTGRKVTALRRALLDAVIPEDIQAVVAALIEKAKEGDLHAISLLFDRCIGKAMSSQETELYTFEYDREDYDPDPMAFNFTTDQIRPLHLKG